MNILPHTATHYSQSGWVLMDFLTSLPYDWITFLTDEGHNSSTETDFFKIVRFLKVMKLARINRIFRGGLSIYVDDLIGTATWVRSLLKVSAWLIVVSSPWSAAFVSS